MNPEQKIKTVEKIALRIEVLTPLHVGDGTRLHAGHDFLLHRGEAFVFDGAEVYLRKAQIHPHIEPGRLLDQYLKPEEYAPESLYHFPLRGNPREIFPQIKTGGRPYLPGSSLKGSLRTALLASLLREKKTDLLQLEWANSKRFAAAPIERRYLGQNPNEDIFKGLIVRDSPPQPGEQLQGISAMSYHVRKEEMREMGPEYAWTVEAFPSGATLPAELLLDHYALDPPRSAAPPNDTYRQDSIRRLKERSRLLLGGLFKNAAPAVGELIASEAEFYARYGMADAAEFYRGLETLHRESAGKTLLLPLGWGAGWRSKTLGMLDLDEAVIKEIQRRYRLGHAGAAEFPLTRRLASVDNGKLLPMGWVLLKV